jgi:hypothetical protein
MEICIIFDFAILAIPESVRFSLKKKMVFMDSTISMQFPDSYRQPNRGGKKMKRRTSLYNRWLSAQCAVLIRPTNKQ